MTAAIIERGVIRLHFYCFVITCNGQIKFTLDAVSDTAMVINLSKLWISSYRCIIVFNSDVHFTYATVSDTAFAICFGIIWIQFNCSVVVLNCKGNLVFSDISVAAMVICFGIIPIVASAFVYSSGKILNCLVNFTFGSINESPTTIGFMRLSGETCRFSIVCNRQIKLSHFSVNLRAVEVRDDKIRSLFNGSTEMLDSLFIVC